MQPVRIFFTKTDEAAYISHLDLQRVMARALRKSGMPVWYSQGFNPHIYMSFALPLPLGQQSLCESVDCKSEAGMAACAAYAEALRRALPRGLGLRGIAVPRFGAGEITEAEYTVTYHGTPAAFLEKAAEVYAGLPEAPVRRKTKRGSQELDLKALLPALTLSEAPAFSAGGEGGENPPCFCIVLPAGGDKHINPMLLCAFLQQRCALAQEGAAIVRRRIFAGNHTVFS